MKQAMRLVAVSLVLAVCMLSSPFAAHAQSGEQECDPILSGLWAGVLFEFDSDICVTRDSETSEQVFREPERKEPEHTDATTSGFYAGLGDSVAAGVGLAGSGFADVCGVSSESYVDTVAVFTGQAYENFACSGATAGDLVTKQRLNGAEDIEAQLDQAFAAGQPELITITAGANDMHWVDFLRKCYGATCGTNFDNAASRGLLAALRVKLNYALGEISFRSEGAPPQVILTGYYQPLSQTCSALSSNLTSSEITWINQQVGRLNDAISDAAANFSFASFAPVSFAGHDICADDPWVQGVNDQAPFHPTAEGQEIIAQTVIRHLE